MDREFGERNEARPRKKVGISPNEGNESVTANKAKSLGSKQQSNEIPGDTTGSS